MHVVVTAATTTTTTSVSIASAATLSVKVAHTTGRVLLTISVKVVVWGRTSSVTKSIGVAIGHGRSHAIAVAVGPVVAPSHGTTSATWPTIKLLVGIGPSVIRATAIEAIVSHRTTASILPSLLWSPEAVSVAAT